jgi:hypothetical protein
MTRFSNPLDHVQVATPCKADWNQMIGSDQVRFCGQCNLNVFNLSWMTRAEAESLIARTEGRLCVKFYRRVDGSIITKDCPVGLRAIRRRVSYLAKAIISAALTFFVGGAVQKFFPTRLFQPRVTMGVMARLENPSSQKVDQQIPVESAVLGKLRLTPKRTDLPNQNKGRKSDR